MAISYKKCPRCGSLYAIRIFNSVPTHDAFLKAEEGKIKLNDCCITRTNPKYYFKNCENEGYRQDAIYHSYKEIKGIRASVGGYFGGYYEVEINFP